MALQVQIYRPHPMAAATGSLSQSSGGNLLWSTKQSVQVCFTGDPVTALVTRKRRSKRVSLKVKSSLDTTSPGNTVTPPAMAVAVAGQVTEVNNDTFWPIVKAAGNKVVVVDMYTQWCGPCKIIAPKYQLLSEKYLDTVFLKLDCNQENKPLAKELGIKVVPTFKILKNGKVVKEITGAKYDDLVAAIDKERQS